MKLKTIFPYSGLDKGIYMLFAARVINCVGNFVFPFLTLYLTSVLGMSAEKAGFFVMISSIAGVPGILLGGAITDRIGRKLVLEASLLASGLCILTCAFLGKSYVIPWLLILSVFFGQMSNPASSAMVADLAPPEKRSSAYSLLYLGINLGGSIGPLIAGFLFNGHIMLLFIGDAATTLLCTLLILIFLKETIPGKSPAAVPGDKANSDESSEKGNTLSLLFKRPYLVVFSLVTALITFVYSQHSFSLPIYAESIFGKRGPEVYGTLMTINCITVVLLTTLLISATKRFNPVISTVFAAALYAVGFGMLYFSHEYYLMAISTVIWTLGEILSTTSFQVYVANHSPASHRGRFNAVVNFISRAGFAAGPAAMGIFIRGRDSRSVWPLTAILAAFCTLSMYLLYVFEGIPRKSRQEMNKFHKKDWVRN